MENKLLEYKRRKKRKPRRSWRVSIGSLDESSEDVGSGSKPSPREKPRHEVAIPRILVGGEQDRGPEIVVTPPTIPANRDELELEDVDTKRHDKDHLQAPPPKYGRHRRQNQERKEQEQRFNLTQDKNRPAKEIEMMVAAALRNQDRQERRLTINLTRSHTSLPSTRSIMNIYGRGEREKMTKEEVDREMGDLLWRMNIFDRFKMGFADIEYRIIRLSFKSHSFAPSIVYFLVVFLLFALIWDYAAIHRFEVPLMAFIRHTGALNCLHFVAVLMSMYCYMMAKLHESKQRVTFSLGLGFLIHIILFCIRLYFEITRQTYAAERAIHYDAYTKKMDDDPVFKGYAGHMDRFVDIRQENEPWEEFVADREHYFKLPLEDVV